MKRHAPLARVLSIPALGLTAGCLGSAAARGADPAQVIDVHARDFAFEAPDTVPAGLATIRLENRGHELHHVQLLRIGGGHGFGEFREIVASGARLPEWVEPVGGPNVPGPVAAEATLRLGEGTYAMICVIPSPTDGQSHFRKGMVHQLVVVPSTRRVAPEPQADARIGLADYRFVVDTALPAGRRVIRVENTGRRKHEVVLFRLAEGRTPSDLLAWASKLVGPPPGTPSGGTTALVPGGVNYVTVDLVPGDYALVCFARDPGEPLSHASHGMVSRVRVS